MELISVTRAEREADLSELHAVESGIRFGQARRQQILGKLATTECTDALMPAGLGKQYVREEVACELGCTPDTARMWLGDAADAQQHYPEMTKLLEAGETSFGHWLAFATSARGVDLSTSESYSTPSMRRRSPRPS